MSDSQLPNDAVRSYMILMRELAIRIDLIVTSVEGRLNLTPPYAREYAYLQFRRCCEIIALGSLVLHGDLPIAQSNSAKRGWNAAKIMRMLHKVHPHAFPQSVITERTPQGMNITANAKPEAMSFDDFKTLYAECGEVPHRGTIRTFESSGAPSVDDYDKVIQWERKLVQLMNEHIVVSANGVDLHLVALQSPSGLPQYSILTPDSATGTMKVRQFTATGTPQEQRSAQSIINTNPTQEQSKPIKDILGSLQKGNWSFSDEREFTETLFVGRFNFFIVFFSLFVAGGFANTFTGHKSLVFYVGAVMLFSAWLPLLRAFKKHDRIMKIIFNDMPDHPASQLEQILKIEGYKPRYRVSRWMGLYIPWMCIIVLLAIAGLISSNILQ